MLNALSRITLVATVLLTAPAFAAEAGDTLRTQDRLHQMDQIQVPDLQRDQTRDRLHQADPASDAQRDRTRDQLRDHQADRDRVRDGSGTGELHRAEQREQFRHEGGKSRQSQGVDFGSRSGNGRGGR